MQVPRACHLTLPRTGEISRFRLGSAVRRAVNASCRFPTSGYSVWVSLQKLGIGRFTARCLEARPNKDKTGNERAYVARPTKFSLLAKKTTHPCGRCGKPTALRRSQVMITLLLPLLVLPL